MGNCDLYLDELEIPILGMCAGHQLIAAHFGGKASAAKKPEFGKTEILVDEQDELFDGFPKSFIAWNSHNDEVSKLSDELLKLAHSKDCPYEAIRHNELPIFGLQFHPEVQHTEYRYELFENFIKICKR
jgi:GMP synthase (glutamine-hydrolysing)